MGFRGRYKSARDANEPEIVATLEAHGFTVERLDKPVDLVFGKHGQTWIAEVKMEGKPLNANQTAFYERWRGNKAVFRSTEDVRDFARDVEQALASAGIPMKGVIT